MKIIAKCTKNKLILYLSLVVCAFSSAIIFSPRSYAVVNQNVNFASQLSPTTFTPIVLNGSPNPSCVNDCYITHNNTSSGIGIQQIAINLPHWDYYNDGVIKIGFNLWRVDNSTSLHSVINSVELYSYTTELEYMGAEYSQIDTNTGHIDMYFRIMENFHMYGTLTIGAFDASSFHLLLQPNDRLSIDSATLWSVPSSASNQGVIDAINSQPNYTQNLNTINNNIQNVQDSIDQSNQDANDRYEDEKDTINTNGEDAQDLWNGATFTLNFTDPFTTLWNLFTDAQCVDITTLATLLNVPSHSTICSPWSPSLRSIFTPCFNLFAIFFAIGFFIRWLSDSTGVNVDYYDTYVHEGRPYFKKRGD